MTLKVAWPIHLQSQIHQTNTWLLHRKIKARKTWKDTSCVLKDYNYQLMLLYLQNYSIKLKEKAFRPTFPSDQWPDACSKATAFMLPRRSTVTKDIGDNLPQIPTSAGIPTQPSWHGTYPPELHHPSSLLPPPPPREKSVDQYPSKLYSLQATQVVVCSKQGHIRSTVTRGIGSLWSPGTQEVCSNQTQEAHPNQRQHCLDPNTIALTQVT